MRNLIKTFALAASLAAVSFPSYADVVQAHLNGGVLTLTGGNFRMRLVNAPQTCGFANNLHSVRTVINSGRGGRVNASFSLTMPCTKVCLQTSVHGVCGIFYAYNVSRR
jgi:hypothetical protein